MGANEHTKKDLARYLKISPTALNNKLKGRVEFKASEIKEIADLYHITTDELYL